MPVCNCCGKVMTEGFVIEGGEEYFCSDECLHSKYTSAEWNEMYGDGDTQSYWTVWEDEEDDEGDVLVEQD